MNESSNGFIQRFVIIAGCAKTSGGSQYGALNDKEYHVVNNFEMIQDDDEGTPQIQHNMDSAGLYWEHFHGILDIANTKMSAGCISFSTTIISVFSDQNNNSRMCDADEMRRFEITDQNLEDEMDTSYGRKKMKRNKMSEKQATRIWADNSDSEGESEQSREGGEWGGPGIGHRSAPWGRGLGAERNTERVSLAWKIG